MNDKKKLKRKLALYFVMLLLLAALLTFSGITLAWFYKGNDQVPADTLSGSIHAAYFNGGKGTAPSANATYKAADSTYPSYEFGGNDGPYQIDNATQLYNFAWLQYLGYFDEGTYFVLTDTIDASEIVLPPIGTEDYPFIGYFDGNGYTISGLRVSNDITALNNTDYDGNKFNIPLSALENGDLSDSAEIVGFFGVVGDNTETYPNNKNFTPTVKNVTLENATIETQTTSSLAGIAAGYVNGVMEDVIVSGTSNISSSASSVLSPYTNLSDYALVGFCEEQYRKSLKVETVNVYEPSVELGNLGRLGPDGVGDAWGNSIDMESIYNELRDAYDAGTTATISNLSAKTVVHYNGTSVVTSTATATVTASSVNGYRLKTTKTTANGSEIASYALIQQEGIDDFVYLYGDKEIGTQNVSVTDIYKEDSLYINDGINYLTAATGNTTQLASAGKWVFKPNGNGTYKIYTISNNTEQYLYKGANNTLSVGSTQDNWTVESANDNKFVISIDGYTLCFKTDAWKLIPPAKNYITDSTMTNYLSVSNGNVVNQTNAGNAASWDKETVANGYMLKTVISGTTYYLKADSGYTITVTGNTAEATVWDEIAANGTAKPKIYTVTGNTTEKALYYDGNNWKLVDYTIGGSGNDWGGSVDFRALNKKIYQNFTGEKNTAVSFTKEDLIFYGSAYRKVNPESSSETYRFRTGLRIPINMDNECKTDNNNTGYILGSNISTKQNGSPKSESSIMDYIGNSLSTATPNYTDMYGTNGVAYAIHSSYDSSKLEVLTYSQNSQTWKRITDSYNSGHSAVNSSLTGYSADTVSNLNLMKYNSSREKIDELFTKNGNSESYIHGISFDTNVVSSSSIQSFDTNIMGVEYTNYQMPIGCIDFKLKESGKINFFAGSYRTIAYSSDRNALNNGTQNPKDYFNGGFFSLHHIIRNPNNVKIIDSIKEIKEIYQNNDGTYVYVYRDNTASGTIANATKVFDVSILWNTAPVPLALYYFEIPVNEGEYAIGAVLRNDGSVNSLGARLLYLDISANATVEGDSQYNPSETAEPVYKTDAGIVEKNVYSTESESIMTPPTYFPLAWNNGAVSSSNTGYIISGAYTNSNLPGDIRVSKYEKSYSSNWRGIGNSLTNGILTDSKIYTYKFGNNGGWQTISQYGTDNLYKYLNSKAQLQDTIGSAATGDVYGLHFMDAPLGTSNLITVPSATINGRTYTNYEMPRDSIDFNLKKPGYINVFAGTYFSGSSVNCFFSLHKIERDANQRITSISEIKAIYEDNGSYNYQYAGGAAPSGTKVFDTDCLTQPSGLRSDTVYYFEIPAGAGEFAIGSVDGKFGGYLLYLDISTHQGDSVVKREKMIINTVEYELPKGVIFEGADKTTFEVPITMTGDIEFIVNNGAVTATSPLTASSASSSKTIEKVTVSDQAGEFSIKRTTENGTVIYEYSERALNENDTIEELAAYFNSSVNNVIFTYNYLLEGNNSVNNVLEDIEYSTDVGFAITRYQITARAIVEAVTATVQAIGSDASYIEFNEVANIQTSQTIIIPTQNNN